MNGATHFVSVKGRFSPSREEKFRLRGIPDLRAWLALLLIVCLLPTTLRADRYDGQVGKLKAIFQLEWGGDNSVGGTYRYPSRKGVVYRLEGEVTEDGKLVLREYTGTNLTAVLMLKDTGGGSKVRWSGKMQNTDGREFEVWFGQ
jgi:hypothetical protein